MSPNKVVVSLDVSSAFANARRDVLQSALEASSPQLGVAFRQWYGRPLAEGLAGRAVSAAPSHGHR
eukprot:13926369-Alexandrium_andersonii.AAC.1